MAGRKKDNRERRAATNTAGKLLQVLLAQKVGCSPTNFPICDLCQKFPSNTGNGEEITGYCFFQKERKLPVMGFCSGLIPVEGASLSRDKIHIDGTLLKRFIGK